LRARGLAPGTAISTRAAPGRVGTLSGAAREDMLVGYLFILPTLIVLGTFLIWPILQTFWMSLFRWDLLSQERDFIGVRNYQLLIADSGFWLALRNTVYYSLGVVPAQTVLALLLAIAANQNIRGRAFFRSAFFFPSISSSIVVALLFMWILQGGGLADWLLRLVGISPPRPAWLANPNGVLQLLVSPLGWSLPEWAVGPSIALLSVMGLNVWSTIGSMLIVFLAGLQDIPRDLHEAAAVDGADARQAFWHVTLPLLRPVTLFVVIVGVIGTLQVFDQIWMLTKGNSGTTTIVYHIYAESFGGGFRAGSAAAMTAVLFAIIFVATLLQLRVFGRRED
jgi:multiple sugar transport system permease protein